MALLHVLPIGTAVMLVFVIATPPAIYAIFVLRQRAYIWDVPLGWSILSFSLLALISVGAAVDLTASIWNGWFHAREFSCANGYGRPRC